MKCKPFGDSLLNDSFYYQTRSGTLLNIMIVEASFVKCLGVAESSAGVLLTRECAKESGEWKSRVYSSSIHKHIPGTDRGWPFLLVLLSLTNSPCLSYCWYFGSSLWMTARTLINIYCVSLKPFYGVILTHFIVLLLIVPYGRPPSWCYI